MASKATVDSNSSLPATKSKKSAPSKDVIGTIVSMGDLIPFGLNKRRRIVMVEDPEGDRLECCFFYAMADMFVSYASNRENAGHVVLIVQLAKVKYWKDNVSVSSAMNGTKIFINADLPEVRSFKTSYQKRDGFDESALKIKILSPTKTIVTPETFFKGAARKNVGDIRDSFNEVTCVVYAKIHKIQKEFGWCYPACKQCSRIAKESEYSDLSASVGYVKKSWRCDRHGMLKSVTHRYKVIVRVIDHTGSASLILFDNMIQRLLDIPCVKLKEQYDGVDDDDFPTELDILIGKKMLFRFLYSEFNINNNNHVYQVKMISDKKAMIKKFKEGFVYEEDSDKDSDEEYDEDATCVNNVDTAVGSTKLSVDIPMANEDDVRNDNANSHSSTTSSFGYQKDPEAVQSGGSKRNAIDIDDTDDESGGSKRNAIDIDDTDDGDSEAKRAKI
ncbi:replication protein A 70 kDa DNA-binding subunit [Artemisia annua]|uniref:Replication protein A 70 kDa DNA-binding subunit n=1 Tax=Artemisia annua TaxID=35608 RepID=A0A2U1M2G6_ARTAN|nr:replication protein A 70 kDa DNA-binding subunit [Artemisia annua]